MRSDDRCDFVGALVRECVTSAGHGDHPGPRDAFWSSEITLPCASRNRRRHAAISTITRTDAVATSTRDAPIAAFGVDDGLITAIASGSTANEWTGGKTPPGATRTRMIESSTASIRIAPVAVRNS